MNNTKENKAKWMIVISALSITVVLIAELFLMINFDDTVIIPIIVLAILALAAVYMLVNSMMTIEAIKEAKRQEHFDNIYKSEKASYIMLKNKFQEIEEKLATIQETSKIPSEEIINAQKGIAKVIINRSKENADAIINSNDQVLERLDEIDETQNTKFIGISKDQRLKLTEMSNQTELKLQDMVVQLKDMELRLNQAIMQGGGTRVVMAEPESFIQPESFEEPDIFVEPETFEEPEEFFPEENLFEAEPLVVEEEVPEVDDILAGLEEIDSLEDLPVEEVEEEVAVEDILEEIEEEIITEEPVVAPEIDLSDPNKALSADDIAALFASMAGDAPAEEEEVVEEPVVEDVPPMPDLSDPNRALSPDEIAALIANL